MSEFIDPRAILNEMKWRSDRTLDKVRITYRSRGAPNDTAAIQGTAIQIIGPGFLDVGTAFIPYHRILSIRYGNEILYKKRE